MENAVFEWNPKKSESNIEKHGISFFEAQKAFLDPKRIIAEDLEHSRNETRYYCFGNVNGDVMTVRFTYRGKTIRIFGAGYWRDGKKIYEKEQKKI